MATLANAIVKLIADTAGFDSAMKKSIGDAAKMGKTWQQTGQQMTSVGQNMTMGITAPLVAAGVAATGLASDFAETESKVGVVFGKMSESVMNWSESAAAGMGMTQQQALAAAGTYGNLMVSMGMTADQSAGMSTSMVKLASDLASFNNMNPTEVLDKLRAGLTGESEPLKVLGININEAVLKQKALEMGLYEGTGALTASAKAQAAYALMMAQTATAQGDFERTSEGLANQQRILKATFMDTATQLGTQLLPIALKVVTAIKDIVDKFSALSPEQQKAILVIAGIAAVLGPVLMIVGTIVTTIGALMPVISAIGGVIAGITLPIWGIAAAVIAVVALIALAWKNNWGGIQEKTAAVWEWLKTTFAAGLQFVQDLFGGKLGWFSEIWKNTWDTVTAIFNMWWENIKLGFALVGAIFEGDWRKVGEIARQIWDNTFNTLKLVFENGIKNIVLFLKGFPKTVFDFFKSIDWGKLGLDIIKGIANGLIAGPKILFEAVSYVGSALTEMFKGFFGIQSPSKLMKVQVGYQLAAGIADGLTMGAGALMPNSVGAVNDQLSGFGGGGKARGGGGVVVNINVNGNGGNDYELAKKIGQSVKLALRQEGLV